MPDDISRPEQTPAVPEQAAAPADERAAAPAPAQEPSAADTMADVLLTGAEARGNEQAAPDEQAAVVLFLASEGASYMNGSIVDVNGGVL